MKLVHSIRTNHAQVLVIRSLRFFSSFQSLQSIFFLCSIYFFLNVLYFLYCCHSPVSIQTCWVWEITLAQRSCATFSWQYFSDSMHLFLLTGHTQHVAFVNFVGVCSIIDQMLYDCTLEKKTTTISNHPSISAIKSNISGKTFQEIRKLKPLQRTNILLKIIKDSTDIFGSYLHEFLC